MENQSGGGNLGGTLFIILTILGIAIIATTMDATPQPGEPPAASQTDFIIPDTGAEALQQVEPTPILEEEVVLPVLPAEESPVEVYTIQPGDTLGSIAQRYGLTLDTLLAANPEVNNQDIILPGQTLRIPQPGATIDPASPNTTQPETLLPDTGAQVYIVQAGDTLSEVAARYNMTLPELLAANPGIHDPNRIEVGQTIQIP